MATYTVRKGRRYRATISLGLLQSVASNDMVADRFREAGFAEVEVTGSGRSRLGQALWPHEMRAPRSPTRSHRSRRSRRKRAG
jgi:hypothetical protein